MEQIIYSKIVLRISEIEDEVLTKQLGMLSERRHAYVERVDAGKAMEMPKTLGNGKPAQG